MDFGQPAGKPEHVLVLCRHASRSSQPRGRRPRPAPARRPSDLGFSECHDDESKKLSAELQLHPVNRLPSNRPELPR